MPVLTSKTVKRRIKSIGNTRKITKAMELVSAAKMRRAVSSALSTRSFAKSSWELIRALRMSPAGANHQLLTENVEAKKTLLILFTADRGLAGGFNANILKETKNFFDTELRKLPNYGTTELEIIAIGRRGADAMTRRGIKVISRFEGLTNKPKFADLLPIGRQVLESFRQGEYRKVYLGYTDYISGLVQTPRIYQLLPFEAPDIVSDEQGQQNADQPTKRGSSNSEYLFEPDPGAVLDRVLPRLIETMLYQALLESAASEHSARMVAMKSASDAALDMLDDLKFTYNQIRQTNITREIAEISSGKAAVE